MAYRVVAIKKMSVGNESVGEMWEETKIFDSDSRLGAVMEWVGLRKSVTLSVVENDHAEFEEEKRGRFPE